MTTSTQYPSGLRTNQPHSAVARPGWRYSRPAIVLHWLIAVLVGGMVALGWSLELFEHTPRGDWLLGLHKSMGAVVFILVLVRLAWRLFNRPHGLPSSVRSWQQRLSAIVHGLLYALLLAVPLAGYLGAAYSRAGMAVFGWVPPLWAVASHDRAEQFFEVHGALVWGLVVLIAAHVAGAIKHALWDRDGVFERMWFRT